MHSYGSFDAQDQNVDVDVEAGDVQLAEPEFHKISDYHGDLKSRVMQYSLLQLVRDSKFKRGVSTKRDAVKKV